MPSFLTTAPIDYFYNELVVDIASSMTYYASTLPNPIPQHKNGLD
jgi:hypothetical protein